MWEHQNRWKLINHQNESNQKLSTLRLKIFIFFEKQIQDDFRYLSSIFLFFNTDSGHTICRKNREIEIEMMGKVSMGDPIIWLPEIKLERIRFPTTFKDWLRLTILLKFATFFWMY